MLLETSAIVCAIMREPGAERLQALLNQAKIVAVSTPSLLEAGLVLSGRGIDARVEIPNFLDALYAERIPFRDEHQRIALSAFLRFGRGRHPAQLNFGDCMSYAVARLSGLPLLYKGDDFGQTDLTLLHRLDV